MARTPRRRVQDDDGLIHGLIYTRVSSDEQAREGLSLPAQLQACRRYAADRGWLIAGEYRDVLSGKRDDRAQYQALLKEAKRLADEGQRVAVVVMRLDRLGRKLSERIASREAFKKAGIQTHSVREGGEVNDMMANMLAVMAEEEVERLAERIQDTRDMNVENGWHTPGRAPWGYRWRSATEEERRQGAPKVVLEEDQMTAPYVRSLFERAADGGTIYALASWVAHLPDEAKGYTERTRRNDDGTTVKIVEPRNLSSSAIRRALSAPVYIAQFHTDEEHQGSPRWPALIDPATWERVQRRVARQRGKSGPVSERHLLARIGKCPKCGYGLSGWKMQGKLKRYRCHAREHGGEQTRQRCTFTISGDPIDALVLDEVRRLLAPLAGLQSKRFRTSFERAWARLSEPDADVAGERAAQIREARDTVAQAKARILEATRKLVDGTIEPDAYKLLAQAEQARLDDAQRILRAPEVPTLPATLPSLDEVLAELGGWQAALDGPVSAQRPILRALIETVVPVATGHRRYEVTFRLTPVGQALHAVALPAK
jgi:DNA invertase Pin-like site-specific DNA recombinase